MGCSSGKSHGASKSPRRKEANESTNLLGVDGLKTAESEGGTTASPSESTGVSTSSSSTSPCYDGSPLVVAAGSEYFGTISYYYELEKKGIGEGTYGFVSRALHKASGTSCAIKAISKKFSGAMPLSGAATDVERLQQAQRRDAERVKREVSVMRTLEHPNIVYLWELFEDEGHAFLVLELCAGGSIFDYISRANSWTEPDVAVIMQGIFNAVAYMHGMHFCHRDIKPDNVLLLTTDDLAYNQIKVVDFGLSCAVRPGEEMREVAGTPLYVAPQVLAGRYDIACDMWSCGVLLYFLLSGRPPFDGDSEAKVLSLIRRGNYGFGSPDFDLVSESAKELVRWLLKMNPRERCTADEAVYENWNWYEAQVNTVQLNGAHSRLRRYCRKGRRGAAAQTAPTGKKRKKDANVANVPWLVDDRFKRPSQPASVFAKEGRQPSSDKRKDAVNRAPPSVGVLDGIAKLFGVGSCGCATDEATVINVSMADGWASHNDAQILSPDALGYYATPYWQGPEASSPMNRRLSAPATGQRSKTGNEGHSSW